MLSIENILREYLGEVTEYIIDSKTILFVLLDKDQKIVLNNKCFRQFVNSGNECKGEKLSSFLSPESQSVLPNLNTQKDVLLYFKSMDSSLLSAQCRVFKSNNEYNLIIGSSLKMTNIQIVEKMTVMSNELANMTRDLNRKNRELEDAQSKIKTLSGIIPICMHCKGIRDDKGYWNQLEKFISENSEAQFSHGICDDCLKKHYSEFGY